MSALVINVSNLIWRTPPLRVQSLFQYFFGYRRSCDWQSTVSRHLLFNYLFNLQIQYILERKQTQGRNIFRSKVLVIFRTGFTSVEFCIAYNDNNSRMVILAYLLNVLKQLYCTNYLHSIAKVRWIYNFHLRNWNSLRTHSISNLFGENIEFPSR